MRTGERRSYAEIDYWRKYQPLLAHPAADPWTTVEASRPFFDRIKGPKELVMLENCGHLPVEVPGFSRLEEVVVAFLKGLSQEKPPNAGAANIETNGSAHRNPLERKIHQVGHGANPG